MFFVQRLPVALGVQPLVVHTTYQFSQARGKRQRQGARSGSPTSLSMAPLDCSRRCVQL